jgi:asparagine synthase (glutamine-hydrolysing)
MCGIAGLWTSRSLSNDALYGQVEAMVSPIVHRGPDDKGICVEGTGIGLGFRRLAIVDLSENGHQPMRSASGRYTVVFNGEIYNHTSIRLELASHGHSFRGHSDTEVMLAAFEEWGIKESLPRFLGMFAFAVWDAHGRALTLARDRVGKKPLFVYSAPGIVAFGSELKSLCACALVDRSIDVDSVAHYLRYLYVPGPRTIFRGIRKVEPGHFITVTSPDDPLPGAEAYWSLEEAYGRGQRCPFGGSDLEAIDSLESLLRDAVQVRMEADVPLGAFLSGGVDSSTVVALMQARSAQRVRTFSIAFDDQRHNEAHHAAAVAAHLGTSHTEMLVTGRDALDAVTRLAGIYDEPMADPSQIPTLLVSSMARQHVTVALSGDGGDEIFSGYNRYVLGARTLERIRRIPLSVRRLMAFGIGAIGTHAWDRAYSTLSLGLPSRYRHRLPGEKIHKLSRLLRENNDAARYRSLVSAWSSVDVPVIGASTIDPFVEAFLRVPDGSLLDRMMFADQVHYLVENQMTKVDRASMAASLEVRVPILDHRVIEFSWRLPRSMKVRDGVGKWILRQVLYRYVPRQIIDRPKMGFSVPLGPWLRGELRPWAESLLTRDVLRADGLLNAEAIHAAWRGMLAGSDESVLGLWAVLQLQEWRRRWMR